MLDEIMVELRHKKLSSTDRDMASTNDLAWLRTPNGLHN